MGKKNTKKDKILRHFDLILDEVRGLVYSLDVWNQLTEIQNHSKHFKKYGGHLQDWLAQNYTYKVIVQIGKITNPNYQKDDVNFIKLLKEVSEKKYISFERFLQSYDPPPEKERRIWNVVKDGPFETYNRNFTVEDAKESFESKTGFPYNHTDFSEMINQDIQKLDEVFRKIKKLRHKKIAHLTTAEIKKVPTYADVEDCINTIKAVAQKYKLIFYHSHDDFHYINLNIRTVFEKAWIDQE